MIKCSVMDSLLLGSAGGSGGVCLTLRMGRVEFIAGWAHFFFYYAVDVCFTVFQQIPSWAFFLDQIGFTGSGLQTR